MSQLEALKNGIRHLEPVDLSASHGPSEIWVRPLSSHEAGLVERMKIQGIRTDVKVDGISVNAAPVVEDVSLLMEKQHQARITTVQFGLSHSGETCSYEQAAELPASWVEALAQVIQRISGMRDPEESFRGPQGVDGAGPDAGDGDAGPVPDRGSPGGDPGGVDSVTA